MLDKQNIVVDGIESPSGSGDMVRKVAHEIYVKMVDYLRLTQSKNTYNRFSDYHYLNIPVSNSTEPIRGIDYISYPYFSFVSALLRATFPRYSCFSIKATKSRTPATKCALLILSASVLSSSSRSNM